MQENKKEMIDYDYYEIDLKKVFTILWHKKILITFITLLSLTISIIYASMTPDIYKSSALLVPSSSKDSLSSKLSSYSPIASLAGFGVASDEITKSQEALERIKSFEFFSNHFLPYIKLQNLVATKEWLPETDTLIYDKSVYDENSDKWLRQSNYPQISIPSEQEAFKTYTKILYIFEDKKKSLISISLEHQSPRIAKKWLDIIIENINSSMREEDKLNAINSINYLNESSQSTTIQSMKDAIASLQETQMQTLMLASANKNYIFKTIDSPLIAEENFKPKRLLIIIFGFFIGVIFGITIAIISYFMNPLQSRNIND
ncbi:Wzz/FepE/Etk N-terminal domain-containing protein [Gammaproteobacteria bacterium]|nr:Wzz/FepE/Etk N-terminal domain-containing protein [Gammaproteobacteria bacterium]